MTTYILIIGVVMMLAVVPSAQAVDYNDVATGNWGSASTWSPSGVRGSGDNITIAVTTWCLAP